MTIVNYDRQTGKFRCVIEDEMSDEVVELLKRIRDSKEDSFTWDTLAAERDLLYEQGHEVDGDLISSQISMITSLEDWGLVKQVPIHHEGKIKDMAFKTTHLGNVLLNIREKKT